MQDYLSRTIREASILTDLYVESDVIQGQHLKNQAMLYLFYTKGSSDSFSIKFETSNDGTNYVQECVTTTSAGTGESTIYPRSYTYGSSGNLRLAIPIKDNYIKVSAIGNGLDLTGSSLKIDLITGIA